MKVIYLKAFTLIAAISIILLSSCSQKCEQGSGHAAYESRKVGDFTKIDVSGGFKINLKQDSSLTVALTTDDNLLKFIKTEVSGGKLHITTTRESMCFKSDMIITIGVRHLDELTASGAVQFISNGKLSVKDLEINLSGAGKADLDVNAAHVTTKGNGVTDVTLKGQASSHSVELTGSGKLHAFDFVVGNYDITTTGAGDCDINVLSKLGINCTGAATIKYKGSPSTINKNETGALTVTKVN